jgi:hypothetical protein
VSRRIKATDHIARVDISGLSLIGCVRRGVGPIVRRHPTEEKNSSIGKSHRNADVMSRQFKERSARLVVYCSHFHFACLIGNYLLVHLHLSPANSLPIETKMSSMNAFIQSMNELKDARASKPTVGNADR